jgi:hypothetical protein
MQQQLLTICNHTLTINMSPEASSINPEIEESWGAALQNEFAAPYFMELKKFLLAEKRHYRTLGQLCTSQITNN